MADIWMICSRVARELQSLETRLSQADRLGRLEVELAAREATLEVQVRMHPGLAKHKLKLEY